VAEPYKNPTDKRIISNISNGSSGRMPYSWMYYDLVKNVSKDKTIHSCQIPLGLVEKLILASTEVGDTVFIHFGGSGNEIILAKQLGRKYVSAEIDEIYYNMIIERINLGGDIPPKYKLPIHDKIINNKEKIDL
jgi:site-specific DNA-methyltransferase (adenine-specific)